MSSHVPKATHWVVRSKNSARYLRDHGCLEMCNLARCYVFPSLVAAKCEVQRYPTWREVREVVWRVHSYIGKQKIHFSNDFSSLEDARRYGEGFTESSTTYRVCRVTRKVKQA